MSTSIFPKGEEVSRAVGNDSKSGGQTTRIHLNRDSLVNEHQLIISVAQSFTGVPTSVDAGRFIKNITVETDAGNLFRCSGTGAVLMEGFYEQQATIEATLAVSSVAKFPLDLHYEMPEALRDMLTSVEASDLSGFDLVIQWADDNDNGFLGGTVPLVATYTVEVISKDMPDMQGLGLGDGLHNGVGQFKRFVEEKLANSTVSGTQAAVRLVVANNTRAVAMIVEDWTGGVFVGRRNDIITNVRLVLGGRERRKSSFDAIRFENVTRRGVSVTGLAVLDFGDDEVGFLNLENAAEALVEYDAVLPAGVTAFAVRFVQDYTRG